MEIRMLCVLVIHTLDRYYPVYILEIGRIFSCFRKNSLDNENQVQQACFSGRAPELSASLLPWIRAVLIMLCAYFFPPK